MFWNDYITIICVIVNNSLLFFIYSSSYFCLLDEDFGWFAGLLSKNIGRGLNCFSLSSLIFINACLIKEFFSLQIQLNVFFEMILLYNIPSFWLNIYCVVFKYGDTESFIFYFYSFNCVFFFSSLLLCVPKWN